MQIETQGIPLSKKVLKEIKYRTYMLIYKSRFPKCDREDIHQELVLAALQALPHHNPAKSALDTFLRRVVRIKAAKLRQQRMSSNRTPKREDGSLNEMSFDKEEQCLVEYGQTLGREDASPVRTELQIDVDTVLATLPPDLRALCEALKSKQVVEAAAELGITISCVFKKIARLRKIFGAAGLTPAACDESIRADRLWQ